MRVLIDTHAFLWWCLDDARLSSTARNLIADTETDAFLSVASAWEIAVKAASGRLLLPEDAQTFVPDRLEHWHITALPVSLRHALHAGQLPFHHRDPFDRMLIAQSLVEHLPIITSDIAMHRYDADLIW